MDTVGLEEVEQGGEDRANKERVLNVEKPAEDAKPGRERVGSADVNET
jgi:hypothetical protein